MILTDELCDRLCAAAREKSRETGIDISFAVCDEHGLPRVYRRFGEALVLSITLVPGKAYTAAVTQSKTKDVAACAAEGETAGAECCSRSRNTADSCCKGGIFVI